MTEDAGPLTMACTADSGCPLGEVCSGGLCKPPDVIAGDAGFECATDADCAMGKRCVPSTRTCVDVQQMEDSGTPVIPVSVCMPGDTQSCGSSKLGECRLGTASCVEQNGVWIFGPCMGAVNPVAETCNGKDDDCDGLVDQALGDLSCGTGDCARTLPACQGGVPMTCTPGMPAAEVCDGRDNDCNGQPDDGLGMSSCGTGACARTVQSCVSGVAQACTPGMPAAEVCNGADDDCDGTVDDGLPTLSCGMGACARTVPSCVNGMAQTCTPGMGGVEACNLVDDDCDGTVDEGLGNLTCGTGACLRTVPACVNGVMQTCMPGTGGAEACNGQDDDCDGMTDEGLGSSTCGTGACERTVQNCSNGMAQSCTPGTPSAEVCNGADDDCNGTADDGLGSQSCGQGVCARTVQRCVGGMPQTCNPGTPAPTEDCNNALDDDCDGVINDGCACTGTQTQSCYSGPAGTAGVGRCVAGTQTCNNGMWGPCVGEVVPAAESCNGLDDDCDAMTDDGLGSSTCGVGACFRTQANCVAGMPQTCTAGTPVAETCNGADDDCNGMTDEGLGNLTCGTGACFRSVPACVGGMPQTCTAGAPVAETCNGQDDDCNGTTDEGLGNLTCGTGACFRSVPACVGGMTQSCSPGSPVAETCNGQDDNCDGTTDEGLGNLTCGTGACFRSVPACVGGMTQTCTAGTPVAETCNGQDDDCNGTNDDGLGNLTCGVGACFRSVAACVGGMPQTCTAGMPVAETCNGQDDDCDTMTDETFPQSGVMCSTGRPGICAAGTYGCAMGSLVCNQTTMQGAEICNNGLDDNCNGQVDDVMVCNCNSAIDNDFDGANQCVDCADNDGTIRPGAMERCNGRDDDCDMQIDEGFDVDGDGFTTCGTVVGGGLDPRRVDCNDNNAFVFPLKLDDCGAAATPNTANNVDDNCNGYVDETCGCQMNRDRDGDGFNECQDCDDTDSAVRPNGVEVCDGKDNDCNTATVDNCGVSDPCGYRQGPSYVPWPSGTDRCRPDLICVSNVATGALTCGSFCNQTVGAGLNDSCAVGEGCTRNIIDTDNLHLCSVVPTGTSTTGQSCSLSSSCRTGSCITSDGAGYCTDQCTHESGCSATTTCHVERFPVTSGPMVIGNFYASRCRLDSRITATKNTGQTCVAGECRGGTDMCVTYNGTARCAEACCTHADCPSGYSCNVGGPSSYIGYTTGGAQIWSFVPSCVPATGNRVAGAACSANADCRSGVCDRNLNICVDFCCSDATCPNMTTCELVPFRFTNGNVSTIRACVFSPVPARIEQR